MELAPEDIDAILDAVAQYAERHLAPLVRPHERIPRPDEVDAALAEAIEMGLLSEGAEAGVGLWENLDDGTGLQLTVRALLALAEVDAGLAWHLHQRALARWVALEFGLHEVSEGAVPSLQGHYGLGRGALPRLLRGAALAEGDAALLSDWLYPDDGWLVLHALPGWRHLLAPFVVGEALQWTVLEPDDLEVVELAPGHGLDAIPSSRWRYRSAPRPRTSLAERRSREVYAVALQCQALALGALALGSVRRARRLAREYAAVRRQGGRLIQEHPAVQLLLGGLDGALGVGEATWEGLIRRPLHPSRAGEVLSARAELHPSLCRAANHAMQVLGGTGYMRDAGVERVLRDVNQLRLMDGTPTELRLFAAEWGIER